jgi:hypothetical protein
MCRDAPDEVAESTRTLPQPAPEVNARLRELHVLLPAVAFL